MVSDEALMLEYQRGSRDAFEELFERHRDALYGFFRRRLASVERAEDLTQETFIAVIRNQIKYEPRAPVRTYLYGIAFRLLASERRRAARNLKMSGLDADPSVTAPLDSALAVQQALGRIEPNEREVLMLREFEQLEYAEISQILHIPLNTVRSRLFRARAALKHQMEMKPDSNVEPTR